MPSHRCLDLAPEITRAKLLLIFPGIPGHFQRAQAEGDRGGEDMG